MVVYTERNEQFNWQIKKTNLVTYPSNMLLPMDLQTCKCQHVRMALNRQFRQCAGNKNSQKCIIHSRTLAISLQFFNMCAKCTSNYVLEWWHFTNTSDPAFNSQFIRSWIHSYSQLLFYTNHANFVAIPVN